MTIEEIKQRKEELGITNQQLAKRAQIPYATVTKILSGRTKSPRLDKLLALEYAIKSFMKDETGALRIPVQRVMTITDYYALPEERRVELIDGVFYDMAAPSVHHQRIAGAIFYALLDYVRKNKGDCLPLISPVDVQLDMDEYTMLQPDVLIVCDRTKDKKRNIYGAPDWVMEVVSPWSKKRDYIIKLGKYQNAGVREYWIIDPEKKQVHVYTNLDKLDQMELNTYSCQDMVPVS